MYLYNLFMKIRLTKSFLYSLFLHGTVVLLIIALFFMSESKEKVAESKRCKIMLSQVCACPPAKAEVKPPVAEKRKKPQTKKQQVKKEPVPLIKEPAPFVKEEVVVQDQPEVEEEVVEEVVLEDETLENEELAEEEPNEQIVNPDAEAALSSAAQAAPVPAASEEISPEDAYVNAHISEIMALLRKNLYYPRMARKRGIEGKVLVRFELLQNGEIQNIEVLESERDILARAAMTTIERLDGKFPFPEETLVLNVPIMYQLN